MKTGDVLLHPPLHRHSNAFGDSGAEVLNLKLPDTESVKLVYRRFPLSRLRLTPSDIINNPLDSGRTMLAALCGGPPADDGMVADDPVSYSWRKLRESPTTPVAKVAAEAGVSAEHLSRLFRSRHCMSPSEYRQEHRFQNAARLIMNGDSASTAACLSGYSDQSHMSRDFRARLKMTPGQLLLAAGRQNS